MTAILAAAATTTTTPVGTAPPGTARPWKHVLLRVAMAVVAFATTVALIRHGGLFTPRPWTGAVDAMAWVLAAGSTLPLLLSQRHPMGVFATTSVAAITLAGSGYPADVLTGPAVALYLLVAGRDGSTRRAALAAGALFAAYLAAVGVAAQGFPASALLHNGLAWGVAWFAGERTRLRREQLAALHARAQRAELEAGMQRQLAVAEERARIARDLHDSAGHAVNVIAVRAGAARLRQDPARSQAALADIETLARHTAAQIDQIVGGLRARDEAILSPPGVASLPTLVEQHSAAGMAVSWNLEGEPTDPGSPADQAIYRCLQEALTNAARHGTGSVEVSLCFRDGCADLTVSNPIRDMAAPRNGGGHGLIGMRERLTLLSGALHTVRRDGTFELRATIPLAGQRL